MSDKHWRKGVALVGDNDEPRPRFARVTVSTCHYEFAHLKRPRGRGSWGFELYRDDHAVYLGNDGEPVQWAPRDMLYSEARAWARKLAVRVGATFVEVCS